MVSDRFGKGRGPSLPACPAGQANLVASPQPPWDSEATSTFTPGPMEELTETFFT